MHEGKRTLIFWSYFISFCLSCCLLFYFLIICYLMFEKLISHFWSIMNCTASALPLRCLNHLLGSKFVESDLFVAGVG